MLSAAVINWDNDKGHCVLSESEHLHHRVLQGRRARAAAHYHEDDMASNLYR